MSQSRARASAKTQPARVTRARASAAPRVQRLERGEGKERSFWEISRTKATIITRFGRHLSAGRRIEKHLADAAEAERTFTKMLADKRKEGYADAPQRVEPGANSVKGVSVRNAELEAMIDEDPDDAQGYLVYADWLQQQGDARGELIVIQHGRSVDPDDVALERAEAELMKNFGAELLGPLARYAHIRTTYRSYKGLSWRHGFLRAARLRRVAELPLSEMIRLLLEHPSGRFLRHLVLGRHAYGAATQTNLRGVFEVLAKCSPRTLDSLMFGDGSSFYGGGDPSGLDLGGLWEAMPRVRSLTVDGSFVFGDVRAEALEELVVAFGGQREVDGIASARWPALKRLALTLVVPSETFAGATTGLFASEGMPALRHLALRRWMTRDDSARWGARDESGIVSQDMLALETLRFAAKRGLDRLELLMPMSEEGARAFLAEARTLPPIRSLAIPTEAIASAALRATFAQRLPGVEWTEPPVEQSLGELEPTEATERRAPIMGGDGDGGGRAS